MDKFEVTSAAMGRAIKVAVLLPPGGEPQTPLPVIYALHGRGASYLSFQDMAPLRAFVAAHPMIVVSFDGDADSCYIDATHRPGSLFTTFFFEELMLEIARRYPTDGQVAVTGFSMGGFGAMHYLLTRPEAFTAASSLSGAFELFDATKEREGWKVWAESLLGSRAENGAAHRKLILGPRAEALVSSGTKLPPLLFLCGAGDGLKHGNRRFLDGLQSVNDNALKKHANELDAITDLGQKRARLAEIQKASLVDFEYRESPGGHDWPYWRDEFAVAAGFHWKHFQKKVRAEKPRE
ncbi:MAG: alpha/beta hydrolase-fold protein [Terrimicrobiaceae bacterium]